MLQTIEAIIDKQGRVHLLETIELGKSHRALVTILKSDDNGNSEFKSQDNESIVGSGEIIDEDLEAGSREIAAIFNEAISKSGQELKD